MQWSTTRASPKSTSVEIRLVKGVEAWVFHFSISFRCHILHIAGVFQCLAAQQDPNQSQHFTFCTSQALADALQHNQSLTNLDLDGNPFRDAGRQARWVAGSEESMLPGAARWEAEERIEERLKANEEAAAKAGCGLGAFGGILNLLSLYSSMECSLWCFVLFGYLTLDVSSVVEGSCTVAILSPVWWPYKFVLPFLFAQFCFYWNCALLIASCFKRLSQNLVCCCVWFPCRS